ncbi:MAG: ferritin family protein [Candidatus Bathyarchaeia archaeon]
MNSGKELVNMIQAQIKLEKDTTRKVREMEEATGNLAAKLLLAEMRLDTEKHAKILQTMLDLMKQREAGMPIKTHLDATTIKLWDAKIDSYVDTLVVKKMLEDHVKVETDMLKHVEKEMKKTDDEALKVLFKHIADDEKKHHEIMETILKKAYEMGP